jgi:mannose-6-phosphate isomerase-like protein (cupin superfamily)
MIRKSNEKTVTVKENLFDGSGCITVRNLLNSSEEMYGKGRAFAHSTLLPGCSIGYHVHKDESETYYFLNGTGQFDDNGRITTVTVGDVTFTGAGEGHGLANIDSIPLEFIALILYK